MGKHVLSLLEAQISEKEEGRGALRSGLAMWLRTGKDQIGLGTLALHLETLRHSGWMLVATVVMGLLNYLSNVFVGRMLGPADYGIFTSLSSLSLVLGVVAGVVQTVVTNYVAHLRSQGAVAQIGALSIYLIKRLLPWGVGGALTLSLASRPLATFLQIPSPFPVIVISTFLIPTAVLPAVQGVLRGLQRFGALGWVQISGAAFRLASAIGLIVLGLGAVGAVASLPLAGLGALTFGLILVSDVFRRRETRTEPRLDMLFANSSNAFLALVCFAVLTNSDVILVKSRFSPTEAGLYSAIAVLGKTTFWISGAVATVFLPKATEQYSGGQSVVGLLYKSLLVVGLLCGGTTAVFFLFPTLIVGALFGKEYLDSAWLIGPYGMAMTFYSLVNVWLIYFLAVQKKRYSYALMAATILMLVLLLGLPLTLPSIVGVLMAVGASLCVVGAWATKE